MELKLETFNKQSKNHNDFIMEWVEKRKFNFHPDCGSEFGMMAFDGTRPIASIYFYHILAAKFVLLGFPIGNPDATKEERQSALDFLVAEAEKKAKLLNYKFVVSYPGNKASGSIFTRNNYQVADEGVVQYIKTL